MTTKNKILVGGAIALLYFLWYKNKKNVNPISGQPKTSDSTTEKAVDDSLLNPKTKAEQLAEQARVAEIAKSVQASIDNEARLREEARLAKLEQDRLAELSLAEYRAEQARLVEQGRITELERYNAEQARLNEQRYSIPTQKALEIIEQGIKTSQNQAYQEAVKPIDFVYQKWSDGAVNQVFYPQDAV